MPPAAAAARPDGCNGRHRRPRRRCWPRAPRTRRSRIESRSRRAASVASTSRWAREWRACCPATCPGLQVTAEATQGSVENLKLIGAGKAQVGFAMVDAAWQAAQGADQFKAKKVDARTLMVLYPNRMQIVTLAGTGIRTLPDLKGRRIADRRAGQRRRGHGAARARGHRRRPRPRHPAGAPWHHGFGRGASRAQDRRVLLGRRDSHRGNRRTGRNTGVQDPPPRSCRSDRRDESRVRPPLRQGHDLAARLSRHGPARRQHRRLEHSRDHREAVRPAGVRHREDADGTEGRARRAAQGSAEHRPPVPEDRLAAAVPPGSPQVLRGAWSCASDRAAPIAVAARDAADDRARDPCAAIVPLSEEGAARYCAGSTPAATGGGAARRDVAHPPLRGRRRRLAARCCVRCTSVSRWCWCSCCSRPAASGAAVRGGPTSCARRSPSRRSRTCSAVAPPSGARGAPAARGRVLRRGRSCCSSRKHAGAPRAGPPCW